MQPSLGMGFSFSNAANFSWQPPAEKLFDELTAAPSCINSDMCLPYTIHIARKLNIPCFFLQCFHNLQADNVVENKAPESEYFVLFGIPDKVVISKAQIEHLTDKRWKHFIDEYVANSIATNGTITNFEELEPAYARDYKKMNNDKVWCTGPFLVSNKASTTVDRAWLSLGIEASKSGLRNMDLRKRPIM
ncbi:UDP-glycosyltransferase 73C1, partial [Mucuna pruriens]